MGDARRTRRCGYAGAGLLLVVPVLAQNAAPPAAGTGEPISLVHKFHVGDTQTWKETLKSDLTVTPIGAQVHEAQLPMTVSAVALRTDRVVAVQGDGATIEATLVSERLRENFLGKTRMTTLRNGKATASLNGKPVSGAELKKIGPRLKRLTTGRVQKLQRDVRGIEITPPGGQPEGKAWGNLVVLPEQPVRVGESWTYDEKLRPAVSTPIGGEVAPETEFHFTFTLKSVEEKDGRHVAVIGVRGASAPVDRPRGTVRKFSRNYEGTCRFDIERGVFVSGQFNADTSVTVAVPAAEREKSAFAPEVVRVDGITELAFAEAPAK